MSRAIDETHDPKLRSWVEAANEEGTDFPIQNLPFGVFVAGGESPRVGVAIGDQILDLAMCRELDLLDALSPETVEACGAPCLNPMLALGQEHWLALRQRLSGLLRAGCPELAEDPKLAGRLLVPIAKVELAVPAEMGDYTDFYASVFHASNVGRLARPDNPLFPNYKHLPIGYHGRASSVIPSGTGVRRPHGQTKDPEAAGPSFGPSTLLDYELEVGFFVGPGTELGQMIPLTEAERHIFGLCLLNDWSARDVQGWEYLPLGPFLGKSFGTSVSPWVVTLEALAPFRCPAFVRPETDPQPLPYLLSEENEKQGGIDLTVEVYLQSELMREEGVEPVRLSRGSFGAMYWTVAQMLTHHASNGCNLRPGDLLGSGTVSGPQDGSLGCLLELTQRGTQPIQLPTGEERRFLADGDEVILRGYCERQGYARIGLGKCRGVVLPA